MSSVATASWRPWTRRWRPSPARSTRAPTRDPDGDAALDQAVEQCLLRLEQRRLADLFDFRRAELAEAEADRDTAAASRLRDAVRELDHARHDLDRRLNDSSLLARHRAHPGRTAAGATTLTTPDPQPTAEPQPLATPAGGPAR